MIDPMLTGTGSSADLLIIGGDVVTMNDRREVLVGASIAIVADRIAAIGSPTTLRSAWPGTPELDARECVITPGMISAHQHLTGDVLARSTVPDDLPSETSFPTWLLPMHQARDADDDELAATLGSVECLRNGVTTIVEPGMAIAPARTAAGMEVTGIRGTVGAWAWDEPGLPYSLPIEEILDQQRTVLESFPAGGRITGWASLVGHTTASDALYVEASALARRFGVGLTFHLSPSPQDTKTFGERGGRSPIEHLEGLGALGGHVLIAHALYLSDAEFETLLRTATALVYCPLANMRLGQGVSRVGRHAEFFLRGGRIALGADAVNAGDSADILRVAAAAAGVAKDSKADPTRLGAPGAFEMATRRGAEAIGMSADIGSIEVGKKADLVIHDTARPEWTPRGDVALQLVWSADGRSVRDVLVDGRVVVRGHVCVTVDEVSLRREAASARDRLLSRLGVAVRTYWPTVYVE